MTTPAAPQPAMYTDLAGWWHLLSDPAEYAGEAAFFARLWHEHPRPIRNVLELGSGGGNHALHLKAHANMTLTDRAPGMLAASRRINPECEHIEGDMRTLRLGRTFDAVFVHDAIMYMTTRDDLQAAIVTAATHCEPGGQVLLVPDFVRETFQPGTECGGHTGPDGRGLRYVEWWNDPLPGQTVVEVDYGFLLKDDATSTPRAVADRHHVGLFSRDEWLALADAAGLDTHTVVDEYEREVFVGVRRG
ncbi:MAG: trans-aconitate 2-methyltransferase [Planctomycetota bacterium]